MGLELEKVECETLKFEVFEKKYKEYLIEFNKREFE